VKAGGVALEDGPLEHAGAERGGHVGCNAHGSSGLSEDGNAVWVTTEAVIEKKTVMNKEKRRRRRSKKKKKPEEARRSQKKKGELLCDVVDGPLQGKPLVLDGLVAVGLSLDVEETEGAKTEVHGDEDHIVA